MKFSFLVAAAAALLPLTLSTDAFAPKAFTPRNNNVNRNNLSVQSSTASAVTEVPTAPIAGMKPGTSGLRKKVEIWQGVDEANKFYVENFIQSLLDTAVDNNGGNMLET
jgi:hypothetical protein